MFKWFFSIIISHLPLQSLIIGKEERIGITIPSFTDSKIIGLFEYCMKFIVLGNTSNWFKADHYFLIKKKYVDADADGRGWMYSDVILEQTQGNAGIYTSMINSGCRKQKTAFMIFRSIKFIDLYRKKVCYFRWKKGKSCRILINLNNFRSVFNWSMIWNSILSFAWLLTYQ